MKPTFRSILFAFAGAGLFANPASAAVSLENGSLTVAFYQVLAGNVVGNNTLIFDLGQASLFRENSSSSVSVTTVNPGIVSGNIGTQLFQAFGANWANDGTVRWMVVGNVAQGTGPISGDPGRTNYFSLAREDFSTSTSLDELPSGVRIQASNKITQFFNNTQNETSTVGNADATQISKNDAFSVDEYVPPTTLGLYFDIGQVITQTLNLGTISGPEGQLFEGALDMHRMLHTTIGADLTAGYTETDAVIGTGQYIGTLTLDSAGNLSVIPEPSAALLGLVGSLGLCLRRRRSA